MHDCRGREIKIGDVVRAKPWVGCGQQVMLLKVIGTNPGAQSCNVACVDYETRVPVMTLNAKETLVVFSEGKIVGSETDLPAEPAK
jgi:hypothetical protein